MAHFNLSSIIKQAGRQGSPCVRVSMRVEELKTVRITRGICTCYLAKSTYLHAKLAEVMIEVLAAKNAPVFAGHPSEKCMFGPLSFRSQRNESIHQQDQGRDVGVPIFWLCDKRLARALYAAFRPRNPIDECMAKGRKSQQPRLRLGRGVAQRVAHLIAEMYNHLRRGHSTEAPLCIGPQLTNAAKHFLVRRRIEHCWHSSLCAVASSSIVGERAIGDR